MEKSMREPDSNAVTLSAMAEECRTIAETLKDPDARMLLLRSAELLEQLANKNSLTSPT